MNGLLPRSATLLKHSPGWASTATSPPAVRKVTFTTFVGGPVAANIRVGLRHRPLRCVPPSGPASFAGHPVTRKATLRMPGKRANVSCRAAQEAMYEAEREAAVRAVIRAGIISDIIQSSFTDGDELAKMDSSPVTVADFAVQAIVLYYLHKAFPSDLFIAEESSEALKQDSGLLEEVLEAVNSSIIVPDRLTAEELCDTIDLGRHVGGDGERTWILDPIDGTKGFMRGDQYCIALALAVGGEVEVGVLGCPQLPLFPRREISVVGSVFHAIKGRGALMQEALVDSERHSISGAGEGLGPKGSSIGASQVKFMESVEKAHSSHETSARIAKLMKITSEPVRVDSQAKYGVLSRGECQVFMRFPRGGYIENVWDHAAGFRVLTEAGGTVTDGRGNALKFNLGRKMDNVDGIVASSGIDHAQLIEAVQAVLHPASPCSE